MGGEAEIDAVLAAGPDDTLDSFFGFIGKRLPPAVVEFLHIREDRCVAAHQEIHPALDERGDLGQVLVPSPGPAFCSPQPEAGFRPAVRNKGSEKREFDRVSRIYIRPGLEPRRGRGGGDQKGRKGEPQEGSHDFITTSFKIVALVRPASNEKKGLGRRSHGSKLSIPAAEVKTAFEGPGLY